MSEEQDIGFEEFGYKSKDGRISLILIEGPDSLPKIADDIFEWLKPATYGFDWYRVLNSSRTGWEETVKNLLTTYLDSMGGVPDELDIVYTFEDAPHVSQQTVPSAAALSSSYTPPLYNRNYAITLKLILRDGNKAPISTQVFRQVDWQAKQWEREVKSLNLTKQRVDPKIAKALQDLQRLSSKLAAKAAVDQAYEW